MDESVEQLPVEQKQPLNPSDAFLESQRILMPRIEQPADSQKTEQTIRSALISTALTLNS